MSVNVNKVLMCKKLR